MVVSFNLMGVISAEFSKPAWHRLNCQERLRQKNQEPAALAEEKSARLRDQVKISGAFCTYVALATAVLHCLGWMTVAPERDEAGLGPVHVRKYRY